jgi:hypothetical protein
MRTCPCFSVPVVRKYHLIPDTGCTGCTNEIVNASTEKYLFCKIIVPWMHMCNMEQLMLQENQMLDFYSVIPPEVFFSNILLHILF